MDYETLKTVEDKMRENCLRKELGTEKCKVLDKYGLYSNSRLYWERHKEKYPVQEYFSHKFAVKSSVLGMVFHIYGLCFAKVKYFENNWDYYIPCIHDYKLGFIETEIYNMEFIVQRSTGIAIDLRELAKIHWLKEFKLLCKDLEEEDRKAKGGIRTANEN